MVSEDSQARSDSLTSRVVFSISFSPFEVSTLMTGYNERAAKEKYPPLRDYIPTAPLVLFVGINPGIRSATVGHHFAGYSNRFWKLLHESGLVPKPISYEQDISLPEWGYGITNLIARASAGIDDLKPHEYSGGRAALLAKIRRRHPKLVALVGVTLYRALFTNRVGEPIRFGLQAERLGGVPLFVLPNPSGRNANYSYQEMLEGFRALKMYLLQPHLLPPR